jgi:1-aminocyclopropane-1-carboxylate deaminase/D-cysteine desulfhydrase-like pyridoxal-dependent ACC family enzyme
LIDSPLRLLGIDVGKLGKGFPDSIARMAAEVCAWLGQPQKFEPAQVPLIEESYVGQHYGVPSAQGQAALRRLATLEGLLLDPVYAGKAFAGLLDLAEKGRLGAGEPIIFVHTGGLSALFAFKDLLDTLGAAPHRA